jgi:hypothetical protein
MVTRKVHLKAGKNTISIQAPGQGAMIDRVHLYFVGKPGIKIAFHVGKNKCQPTMKGKKNEQENYRTISRSFQAGI